MKQKDFRIIPYSDEYKTQIRDLVGKLLVFAGAVDEKDLPIDDEDLGKIPQVYSGKNGFWLAVDGDNLIGTVGMKEMGEGVYKLKRMFVLPEYHGMGVGQSLFDYVVEQALVRGCTKMILNTNEHMKRAHHFYEKNGFMRVGQNGAQIHYEKVLSN